MADEADDDGLQIVLTPVQLAALLQGGTVTRGSTLSNRFWGAMSVIGGAAEMVASLPLWLAPEPTLATKVGAGALTYLGADVASTGAKQVWTGRRTLTLSAKAVRKALGALGVDPDLADRLGRGTDDAVNLTAVIAAPLSVARTAQAVRVAAIDRGLIDLEVEETFPGAHTIAKHVGKTVDELKARLAAEPRLRTASSFRTLDDAERAVSEVIRVRAVEIEAWATQPHSVSIGRFSIPGGPVTGIAVDQAGSVREVSGVIIVLKKIVVDSRLYYVLTAYAE